MLGTINVNNECSSFHATWLSKNILTGMLMYYFTVSPINIPAYQWRDILSRYMIVFTLLYQIFSDGNECREKWVHSFPKTLVWNKLQPQSKFNLVLPLLFFRSVSIRPLSQHCKKNIQFLQVFLSLSPKSLLNQFRHNLVLREWDSVREIERKEFIDLNSNKY